jgi:hypothetical protein
MGNVAIAEELAGSAELDELYTLDASESGPEDDEDEEDEEDQEDDEDEDEGPKPQGMPHG